MSKLKRYLNEVREEPEKTRTFQSSENLLSDKLQVKAIGQNVERSYEDRDVYINITLSMNEIQTWIKGEESIELGKMLIEAGNDSLRYNRNQAYEIIQLLAAKEGIAKGEYSRLVITKKSDETPVNYGPGFHYYDLLYVSTTDMSSRLIPDVVIYWSPFEDEYDKQIEMYSSNLPVDTIGWSFQEIKDKFEDFVKQSQESM